MIRTKYVIAPIKNIAIEGRTTILMNVDKIKEILVTGSEDLSLISVRNLHLTLTQIIRLQLLQSSRV